VWAAKKLLVSYCKNSTVSSGCRDFVAKFVPKLKERYPHLEITIQEKSGVYPHLLAQYQNGREKPI
ncbi:NADH dehydrogenase 1 alpha subcomplex 2, partial [Baffinella frigidus]